MQFADLDHRYCSTRGRGIALYSHAGYQHDELWRYGEDTASMDEFDRVSRAEG